VIQSKNSAMCSWFILFGIIQAAIEIGMFHHFNYLLSVLGEKELLNPTNGRSARNQPQRKRSWDRHEARIENGMKIKEQQHMIAADLYCSILARSRTWCSPKMAMKWWWGRRYPSKAALMGNMIYLMTRDLHTDVQCNYHKQ
jgi:hypothetical protein